MTPPCSDSTASALAVSIGLPPPKPMIASAAWALTASIPALSDSVVGSGTVFENNAAFLPAASMIFINRSALPLPTMKASVTRSGRSTFRSFNTDTSSSTAPGPSFRNRGNEMLATMHYSFVGRFALVRGNTWPATYFHAHRGQVFWGKPRLMPPWLGSSQRLVTALPRVKKWMPSVPWA